MAVWNVYRPFKVNIFITLCGLFIAQLCGMGYNIIGGHALDALTKSKDISLFATICLCMVLVNQVHAWTAQFRENQELKNLDYDLKRSMRHTTAKKMLSLSLGQHHSEHSGIKHRIVAEGENSVVNIFNVMTFEIIPFVLEITISAIACIYYEWRLGLVVTLSVILTYRLSKRYTLRYADKIVLQDREDDKTSKLAREIVQHVDLIKLNSKEKFAVEEQDRLLRNVSDGWKAIWIPFNNALWNASLFPRIMRSIVLFFAGLQAYNGDLTLGSMLIVWRFSDSAVGRLGAMSHFQRVWKTHSPRIARYVEFLEVVPDVQNAPDALKIPSFKGDIEFCGVSFQYSTKPLLKGDKDEEKEAIVELGYAVSNVSFKLMAGRRYALVGESGAGKTTIKHLAVRSYDPTVGVIKIDGYHLPKLELEMLRSRIGVVDQEVPLLDRSLRENLLYLLPDGGATVSDDEIWEACRMASIDKFQHRLTHGLETKIGERGVKLSGGERQRVAIARAILKHPDIFIFDEATSSLDGLVEDNIVASIKAISEGKTTLMIAHRFSTILSADEIIVMSEGTVVGQGTHKNLFETCPAYRRLVDPQIRIVQQLASAI
jgi:ABC-type multidrug transport system fused ATPase/permease subunit